MSTRTTMTMKTNVHLFVCLLLCLCLKAQHRTLPIESFLNKSPKQLFELYQKYNSAVAADPGNAKALFERGWLRNYMHDTVNAIADLEKAISLDPENPFYRYTYASILFDKNEYEKVISESNEALKYDKTFVDMLVRKATALDYLERYEEARENYSKALQIDSIYEDTYLQYASSYEITHDFDKSEKLVQLLLRRYPNSIAGLTHKAKLYVLMQKYKEAIIILDKLIKPGKQQAELLLLKGLVYDTLKNQPKACECIYNATLQEYNRGAYQYIMEKCPKEQGYTDVKVHALLAKGNQLLNQGNYAEALQVYDEAIKLSPDSGIAYYNRGLVKDRMKDQKGALEDFLTTIKKSPYLSEAYLTAGLSYAALGEFLKAQEFFAKCMKRNPLNAMAYYNYAIGLSVKEKKYEEAIYYYRYTIDLNPGYALAYYWLGEAYGKLGRNAEACEVFKMAEKLGDIQAISKRIWHCNQ